MGKLFIRSLCLFLFCSVAIVITNAAPTEVRVMPPEGARFLIGQKFDIRVEGKGSGNFSATLSIDGREHKFTSGIQNSSITDGITMPGFGGFNLRGYSNHQPGTHVI